MNPEDYAAFSQQAQSSEEQQQNIIEAENTKILTTLRQEREAIKVKDNSKYPQAKVVVRIGMGVVVAWLNADPNASYKRVEAEENWIKYMKATITWYLYTHTYQDLWIKITTPPLYEPYFFEKTNKPILIRNGNVVYLPSSKDWTITYHYLEVFFKDPSLSLKDAIEKEHLWTWCIAYNLKENWYDFAKDSWFKEHKWKWVDTNNFFSITWPGWSLGSDIACRPDKQFSANLWPSILFVQSKYHKDRYYKVSMPDGCAPGPCSIFGNIEFF